MGWCIWRKAQVMVRVSPSRCSRPSLADVLLRSPFKSWQKVSVLFTSKSRLLTKSLSQIYSFDPFALLDPRQHHLVLGGEALLWTEQAGPENLDSIVW